MGIVQHCVSLKQGSLSVLPTHNSCARGILHNCTWRNLWSYCLKASMLLEALLGPQLIFLACFVQFDIIILAIPRALVWSLHKISADGKDWIETFPPTLLDSIQNTPKIVLLGDKGTPQTDQGEADENFCEWKYSCSQPVLWFLGNQPPWWYANLHMTIRNVHNTCVQCCILWKADIKASHGFQNVLD